MSLIGKMINSRLVLILASLVFVSLNVYGEDYGQTLLGQTLDEDFKEIFDKTEEHSHFVPGYVKETKLKKTKEKTPFIPGSLGGAPQHEGMVSTDDTGVTPLGSFGNSNHFIEHNISDILKDIEKKGKKSLSINYFRDTFNYYSDSGMFDEVYRDDKKSYNVGTLQFSYLYFLSKSDYFETTLGGNLGVGYNQGPGRFEYTNEVSDATFRLVTIPLDLALGFGIRPGKWMKFNFEGGPSVMGLYQTRSDKGSKERYKRRRQVSYGFYGQGSLKISLSNIFSSYYHSLYYGARITKVWLTFLARYHNFANFQDPTNIKIDGASFGIGFSFETL